jgi:hypothetical protein
MTCHHCQTWNLDDDHRCRRCGRRVKTTPSRISPETYPIAATATAPAYDFSSEHPLISRPVDAAPPAAPPNQQQALFSAPINDNRVIPFDSLKSAKGADARRESVGESADSLRGALDTATVLRGFPKSPGERESIRARAIEFLRPAPLKSTKVEVRHAKPKKTSPDQRRLDFQGQREVVSQPQSHIICLPCAPKRLYWMLC